MSFDDRVERAECHRDRWMAVMVLESISGLLDSMGVGWALIGGQALALRGHPRLTVDYDFLTTDRRVFERLRWKGLEDEGAVVDIRRGDFDDPLGGVVHVSFPADEEADVIVAKFSWQQAIVERAEPLLLHGLTVPVPRTADLILLKLAAGGYLDLQDVYSLLRVGDRDALVAEVATGLAELPSEAREAWKRVVDSE